MKTIVFPAVATAISSVVLAENAAVQTKFYRTQIQGEDSAIRLPIGLTEDEVDEAVERLMEARSESIELRLLGQKPDLPTPTMQRRLVRNMKSLGANAHADYLRASVPELVSTKALMTPEEFAPIEERFEHKRELSAALAKTVRSFLKACKRKRKWTAKGELKAEKRALIAKSKEPRLEMFKVVMTAKRKEREASK